jgi:ATP-dependent Clp protease adaptor protein ClpS
MTHLAPVLDEVSETDDAVDTPVDLVVLDDPVNLISYVSAVFQRTFGWGRDKALTHTMEVHNLGRSVVFCGGRSDAERYARQLRSAGLWTRIES